MRSIDVLVLDILLIVALPLLPCAPILPACYPSPTFSLPTRIPLSVISHFNSRTTAGPTIVLSNSLRTATTSGLWGSLLVNPGEVEADVTVLTILVRGSGGGWGFRVSVCVVVRGWAGGRLGERQGGSTAL
jgi:hypothetical protein